MINGNPVILVVDDETKIVRVIKDFLTSSGYEVLTAHDGESALEIYCNNSKDIDLLLLDVAMPNMDGITLLEEIRKDSQVPAIFLTAKAEEYDEIKGFEVGADDYIVKPISQSILLLRIEALLKRVGISRDDGIFFGEIELKSGERTVEVDGNRSALTRREYDLLYYFIVNTGQIMTREQIINNVWGYEFDGDVRTVDTHIKQLRNKLGDKGSYLKTIHRVGYKFEVCHE